MSTLTEFSSLWIWNKEPRFWKIYDLVSSEVVLQTKIIVNDYMGHIGISFDPQANEELTDPH